MKKKNIDNYSFALRSAVKNHFTVVNNTVGSGIEFLNKIKTNLHQILNEEFSSEKTIDDFILQNEKMEMVKVLNSVDGKHPFSL